MRVFRDALIPLHAAPPQSIRRGSGARVIRGPASDVELQQNGHRAKSRAGFVIDSSCLRERPSKSSINLAHIITNPAHIPTNPARTPTSPAHCLTSPASIPHQAPPPDTMTSCLYVCVCSRGVIALNSTLTLELQPQEQETGSDGAPETEVKPRGQEVETSPTPCTCCSPRGQQECQDCRSRRDILSETKYIELVLVVDHQEFVNYQKDNQTVIYRMLDVANQVDWFYRALNVRVALTGLEIWNDRDKIHIEKKPTETLHNFLQWRTSELLPRIRHDNAQLVM
ncbi:hypothetical protein WMY93_033242 [Mugilogobius chulae]|uniref:Peptidase M12B domain-containing protein n=1 Tax=Mugilogobius chulae TaxID=88201 RepID=A0AAW0MUF1_9GOBI